MRLTSMDISQKEFKYKMRGYDQSDVQDFLENVAEDYDTLYRENSSLREKVAALNDKLEQYNRMETTIQNTLLLAQNAAEQSKLSAQKEAELIIKNANESSQKILDKAHNDVIKINDDYEKIKQEFIKFRTKFKNFMGSQIDMFNSLERDFVKNYSIGNTVDENLKEKEVEQKEVEQKENQEINYIKGIVNGVNFETRNNEEFKVKNIKENELNDNSLGEIKNFFVKGD